MNKIVWHVETPCSGYICDGKQITHYATALSFDISSGITVIQSDDLYSLIGAFISACNSPTTNQSRFRATIFCDPHTSCLAVDFEPIMPDHYTVKAYLQMISRRMSRADLLGSIQETDRVIQLMQLEGIAELRLGQLDAIEKVLLLIASAIIAKRKTILIGRSSADTELCAADYNQRIMPILKQAIANCEDLSVIFLVHNGLMIGGWNQFVHLDAEEAESV